jgi:hypothetical protein
MPPSGEGVSPRPARSHAPCPALTLVSVEGSFAICRLAADAPLPDWVAGGPLLSITRTADELSVVCPQQAVPEGVRCERNWRCLRVAGTLDFSLVGVLAALLGPLAGAGISVLAVSTFDTDYLLVKEEKEQAAIDVLRHHGHVVQEQGRTGVDRAL